MPFMSIKVSGELGPDQVARLQEGGTRLLATVLQKKPELSAVLVEPGHRFWSVGAKSAGAVAHLEVAITRNTNSDEQKARFIAGAMGLLRDVVGPSLNPVSYVVIREIDGESWGWDGLTQAARAAKPGRVA